MERQVQKGTYICNAPLPQVYTVDDIAQILGIGRNTAYSLVKEGHFKTIRIGTSIRISKQSFDKWLNN